LTGSGLLGIPVARCYGDGPAQMRNLFRRRKSSGC
ncbi:uncharacterized protein METZ01_LOCUS483462, partial [marine metagenome]